MAGSTPANGLSSVCADNYLTNHSMREGVAPIVWSEQPAI